jgi:folate-dependent tRNA-U54 methylase TrmFO/GidA
MHSEGIIKSHSRFMTSSNRASIEVQRNEIMEMYFYKRKSISNFILSNSKEEIVLTSEKLAKSFIKKMFGIGDLVFYNNTREVLRVTTMNKYIIYDKKKYEYNIEKSENTWTFSTDDFVITSKICSGEVAFSFFDDYFWPCIACAIRFWSYCMQPD